MSIKVGASPFERDAIVSAAGRSASEEGRLRRRRFERLTAGLRPELYRYAFWLARDPALAEDVVQEALLRGWRAFGGLRDAGAAKRWLFAIIRREHARLYQRKRLKTVDIDALAAAEQRLIASTDDVELQEIRQAVFRLEEDYREPLVLQVLMGYRTDEIAQIMGITRQNVLTRLHRARRRLKAGLGLEGQA